MKEIPACEIRKEAQFLRKKAISWIIVGITAIIIYAVTKNSYWGVFALFNSAGSMAFAEENSRLNKIINKYIKGEERKKNAKESVVLMIVSLLVFVALAIVTFVVE